MKNIFTHDYTVILYQEGKFCFKPEWVYTGMKIEGKDIIILTLMLLLIG